MRSVAIARYRLLTNIRSAGWTFGTSIVLAAMPVLIAGVWIPDHVFRWDPVGILELTARIAIFSYFLHTLVLTAACNVFGMKGRRQSASGTADLLEATPLTPRARFWGDAAGIFASAMAVHLVALPLLALAVALSPFSSVVFVWLELAVIALVLLESSAGSWKLHAPAIRLPTVRSAGSAGAFAILLAIVTIATTRWRDLRDSLGAFVQWPTSETWAAVVDAVDNPALYAGAVFVVYAGFIMYFYVRTVRTFERA